MTNKRMYFDCAIKALYMMKEFDIKIGTFEPGKRKTQRIKDGFLTFCEDEFIEFSIEEIVACLRDMNAEEIKEKFYMNLWVAPESEEIFLPKEGDLVNVNEDEFCIADKLTLTQKINKIIMRNSKPFFVPLTEEPNV